MDLAESPARKKWWIWIAALLLVLLVAGGAVLGFRQWQQKHLAAQGRAFLVAGEYAKATLTVRQLLQLDPGNVEAARMAAELLDKAGFNATVAWRGRAVALAPDNPEDLLSLAKVALRYRETATAKEALQKVPAAKQGSADYLALAGTLAFASRNLPEAEKHFAAALQLEPGSESRQFQLANVQLFSPDPAARKRARVQLEALAQRPSVRIPALRALITDPNTDFTGDKILTLAQDLQATPTAAFLDKLVYLDLLFRAKRPDFPEYLARLRTESSPNRRQVFELMSWMNAAQMTPQVLEFAESLPEGIRNEPPVALALVQAYAAAGDWKKVQTSLRKTGWKELGYIRNAYLSRAAREAGDREIANSYWLSALSAAHTLPQRMYLAQLADSWGWVEHRRQALWEASTQPGAAAALDVLAQDYSASRDTAGMLRVATRTLEVAPANDPARNNVAMLSLLLKRDTGRAVSIARELFNKHPTNPIYVSTYAFALHQQGKSAEALPLLRALPAEALANPSVATYYGLILAATGATAEAVKYLDLGAGAALLPEEQQLVLLARRGLPGAEAAAP